MTPTQAFTKILGHAPTGMAATIAQKGYFVVVDDADYAPQSYINKKGNLIGFDVDVAKQTERDPGRPGQASSRPSGPPCWRASRWAASTCPSAR